jgi:hypothetical protein
VSVFVNAASQSIDRGASFGSLLFGLRAEFSGIFGCYFVFMKSAGFRGQTGLLLFFFCNNRLPAAGAVGGPGRGALGDLV